jgi:hypothetical protein
VAGADQRIEHGTADVSRRACQKDPHRWRYSLLPNWFEKPMRRNHDPLGFLAKALYVDSTA